MTLGQWREHNGVSRTTAWRMVRDGRLKVTVRNGKACVDEDLREGHTERNLAGQRFGALVVEKDSGHVNRIGEVLWATRCDCGNRYDVTAFTLRNGWAVHCGCGRKGPAEQPPADVGELTATHWARIVAGAKKRGVTPQIDQKAAWELFLKQGRCCALTGRALTMDRASLDLCPEEPRWIHRELARILAVTTPEELRLWARAMEVHARKKPRFEAEQFELVLTE